MVTRAAPGGPIEQAMMQMQQMSEEGNSGGQAGTGLYIHTADLNDDGWKDIVVPGKSGTHILWNKGKRPLKKKG